MNEEIIDTSGFYRVDVNGAFQFAPNFVHAPDYDLLREDRLTYTYPTMGDWYWFDVEDDAYTFFDIPLPIIEEGDPNILSQLQLGNPNV